MGQGQILKQNRQSNKYLPPKAPPKAQQHWTTTANNANPLQNDVFSMGIGGGNIW